MLSFVTPYLIKFSYWCLWMQICRKYWKPISAIAKVTSQRKPKFYIIKGKRNWFWKQQKTQYRVSNWVCTNRAWKPWNKMFEQSNHQKATYISNAFFFFQCHHIISQSGPDMWWKTYYYLEIRFSCNGKGPMIDFLVLVSVDSSINRIGSIVIERLMSTSCVLMIYR